MWKFDPSRRQQQVRRSKKPVDSGLLGCLDCLKNRKILEICTQNSPTLTKLTIFDDTSPFHLTAESHASTKRRRSILSMCVCVFLCKIYVRSECVCADVCAKVAAAVAANDLF